MGRVTTAFGNLSTAQKSLGALAVGAGLVGTALAATIRPAIEFESAFAGVRKTVDGSPAQLQAIRDGLLDMSRVMPTSAVELAAIAENAGQLGVQAPNVLEFTRSIAQLGETTDLSFEDAAQSLARFLNITGSGAAGITSVADSLVNLGNNSATTESQIVNFATRLASALTIAGASEEQILGLAAGFSSLGLRAEAGGSALSRIFTSISDAARTGGDDLQTYADTAGLLPEQFAAIAEENPAEAFFLFSEGLQRVNESGGTITPILEDIELGGLRTSEVFRLAALNSDFLRDSTFELSDSFANAGAAQEEYDKRIETTASRLEILQGRLNTVAIAAGTPLLDGVVLSADAAGDAIEALANILAPLGAQLFGTFENLAEAVAIFYDALGAPVLGVAVAALTGATVAASGFLEALNALGPAGVILAALIADLTLVGPVSISAASGLAAFRAATVTATGPLVIYRAAVQGLTAALGALLSPLGIITVGLAAIGFAYIRAGQAAEESAGAISGSFNQAVLEADYARVAAQIGILANRLEEVEEAAQIGDGGFFDFDRLTASVRGAGEVLTPFTENTVLNARRELEALQEVAGQNGFGTLQDDLRLTSQGLGISKDSVLELAGELDNLGLLTDGTTDSYFAFVEQIREASAAQVELADRTGISADKIIQGTATLDDYALSLGITTGQLQFLGEKLEEVNVDDLLDPDAAVEAEGPIRALVLAYDAMAEQIGTTTTELLAQQEAAAAVAFAHNELQQAVLAAADAMKAVEQQQRITADASDVFAESLANVATTGLQPAAEALQSYLLNYAASGVSFAQFESAQSSAIESFIATARAAGESEESIADYLLNFAAIPEGVITELILEGDAALAASQEYREEQARILTEILTSLDVDDEEARAKVLEAIANLEQFGQPYNANLTVTGDDALSDIGRLNAELDGYDNREADATLGVEDEASPAIEESVALAEGFERRFEGTIATVDEASPVIQNATIEGTGFASTTFTATAEAVDAASVIFGLVTGSGLDYAGGDYTAEATAEDSASPVFEAARSSGQAWADADYTAQLDAGSAAAEATIAAAQDYANSYAAAQYLASLTAEDGQAQATILGAQAAAVGYSIAQYQATMSADNAGALIRIAGTAAAAAAYATTYTATLRAVDNASATIRRAISTLSGFRSRTIYLTTVRRTVTQYAEGGIDFGDSGIPSSAIRESPGRAQIYPASTSGRYFAEPETGGEAYIPMGASKRPQALAVFNEVGRMFGVFNNGGFIEAASGGQARVASSSVQISGGLQGGTVIEIAAPIAIEVNAAEGMSVDAVRAEVQRGVQDCLNAAGRQLANTRRR